MSAAAAAGRASWTRQLMTLTTVVMYAAVGGGEPRATTTTSGDRGGDVDRHRDMLVWARANRGSGGPAPPLQLVGMDVRRVERKTAAAADDDQELNDRQDFTATTGNSTLDQPDDDGLSVTDQLHLNRIRSIFSTVLARRHSFVIYNSPCRYGNGSAPMQLAQCRFPGLHAISNAKILMYIFQIKCTEAILSNSTRKLLRFKITEMLIAV